jgi:uncharacterized protein with GYD domain
VETLNKSTKRADAFIKWAKTKGVVVKDIYWTTGGHDGVLIVEAPDEIAATAAFLKLASAGNVRTQTMRAFKRDEFESCLPKP